MEETGEHLYFIERALSRRTARS